MLSFLAIIRGQKSKLFSLPFANMEKPEFKLEISKLS